MTRTTVPPVAGVGEPRLTAGFAEYGRLDLAAHEDVHGPIGPMEPAALLRLAEAIDLKGKGGAGFPFARKLRAVLESCERQDLGAVVVVNATEGSRRAGRTRSCSPGPRTSSWTARHWPRTRWTPRRS